MVRFSCDNAIVGAGIAGLALIQKLEEHTGITFVIEAGRQAEFLKEHTRVSSAGLNVGSPSSYRAFGIGGTSQKWGGNLVPFTNEELKAEGWEFLPEEVQSFLPQSLDFLELGASSREILADWAGLIGADPGNISVQKYFRKINKDKKIGVSSITPGPNVKILNNYRVTRIKLLEGNFRNEGKYCLELLGPNGAVVELICKRVVLTCGALEALRLLHNSPDIKLSREHLGRKFSTHLSAVVGLFATANSAPLGESTSQHHIEGRFLHLHGSRSHSELSWKVTLLDVRNSLLELPPMGLRGIYVFALFALARLRRRSLYLVNVDGSQTPYENSRIYFDNEDLVIFHDVTRKDLENLKAATEQISKWLLQFGRAKFFPISRRMLMGKSHHLGGLSMGVDPLKSLVNGNLELHQNPGIFVCSTAIYPTFSSANPTLLLVQLSLRLGDYLNRHYKGN